MLEEDKGCGTLCVRVLSRAAAGSVMTSRGKTWCEVPRLAFVSGPVVARMAPRATKNARRAE